MKKILLPVFFMFSLALCGQKRVYDIELFGKKIGQTTVERVDKGNGDLEFKLNSRSEVNILFTHKTSIMDFDIIYKDGKYISSYCKSVKDDVTEITKIAWDGTRYLIKKGEETLQLSQLLDFSAVQLYFIEPKQRTKIFSERIGQFCNFIKTTEGVYECKSPNGVLNIYRYRNGILYEMEMSKGASVFMKLVQ